MKAILIFFFFSWSGIIAAQDTFSILAYDSITREVGAAGASCVDLFTAPGYPNDFICELFPDTGAIACQAAYIPQNQKNARYRMRLGDNAPQLISWLQANDVGSTPQSNFTLRQYGVIRMDSVAPPTAAFTGTSCMDYKGHRVGRNYTIHGNILLGASVLDSMQARFLRAQGDLACKLMYALQGANVIGADSRCATNGSSSLFAFLKVSLPTDTFGMPSFIISLKSHSGDQIEPIDSLQKLFDAARTCTVELPNTTGIQNQVRESYFEVFPNPASQKVCIRVGADSEINHLWIIDLYGRPIYSGNFRSELILPVRSWSKGVYFFNLRNQDQATWKRVVIE